MGAMSMMGGAGGGAVARVSRMPSPSIIASSTPPNAALFAALRMPALHSQFWTTLQQVPRGAPFLCATLAGRSCLPLFMFALLSEPLPPPMMIL